MFVRSIFSRYLPAFVLFFAAYGFADSGRWQSEKADINVSPGRTIKKIRFRDDKFDAKQTARGNLRLSEQQPEEMIEMSTQTAPAGLPAVGVNVIDSPPIDGFIPWIAVTTTDKRKGQDDMDFNAVERTSIFGSYTADNYQTDYAIGIFDTGASASIIGYADAARLGLYSNDMVTDNDIPISGVTGSVLAGVSYPLGLYIDGLDSVAGSGLLDTSDMVGETNVSVITGRNPGGNPDLPTAIGTPLSVYFTAVIKNDTPISYTYNSTEYTGPRISFHNHDSNEVPSYAIEVPMELRPLGGIYVQYLPDYNLDELLLGGGDIFFTDFSKPSSPSVIMGNLSQSVFFVHSVDITHGIRKAADKTRFMLDTGAQVTVIGKRIGARLGLDQNDPDFTVEIEGVSGEISYEKGYVIDKIEIPALGGWLTFTNVPVILLDVASPEGGTLDGIIGMNLFVDYNIVLRGGGLFLEDDPSLQLEYIGSDSDLSADIAPPGTGDGTVDLADAAVLGAAWLAGPNDDNWNSSADMATMPRDFIINFRDFAVLASQWLGTEGE